MTRIGPYTLHTLETGRFRLDGGAMFGIVPKPLWARRLPPDERNRITLAMRCLLLESSDRLVLIDTGIGDTYDDRFADLFAIDHAHSDLHRSLAGAGFSAADVTDVILTHLHFDHAGGGTRRVGDRLVPAFPSARYHVQAAHWSWAMHPNPREKGSFLAEKLEPLAASGQLHLVEGPGPLLPGVEVMTVDGHTEAQQIVKIGAGEDVLVFVADLLPTTHHLAPAWGMAYDVRPLVALEEKALLLEQALQGGWQLFFEHDPDVAVADLERTERGIRAVAGRPLAER